MKRVAIYVCGRGGSAAEAERYRPLLRDCDVLGFEYRATTPWGAREEFAPFFESTRKECDSLLLIANSLGAYFAMSAEIDRAVDQAFFISPVVDMERLILGMLARAGFSETELREKREIATSFGEPLSWEYLNWTRAHPLQWRAPTEILVGERDELTAPERATAFANRIGARLTVMPRGEHWFHTREQLSFLDAWLQDARRRLDASARR